MRLSSIFIPFDAYERNKKIAQMLKGGETVLDVGGGITGLKLFTQNPATILDKSSGDIKADARNLDLPDESYEVVTSIDVLEHIPPSDRENFIENLLRIAKKKVILSAPFGSREHIQAEKKLLEGILDKKSQIFLKEHIKNGLPTPKEVLKNSELKSRIFYSGDFRISNFLYRLHNWESGIGPLDKIFLYLKSFVNFCLNLFAFPFWFYNKANKFTNRFYIEIIK